MSAMFMAFARALRDMLSPRMLLLAVWPLIAALALWLGLAWWYWADWTHLVGGWLGGSILADWLSAAGVSDLAHLAAWLLLLLLLLPVVLLLHAPWPPRAQLKHIAVAGLLTLLEPLMIALLGGVVGGIVIAMYMPIFSLISKLS